MTPARLHCHSPLQRLKNGFTLVELTVGTAIGALMIIITTGVLSPQLRMNQLLGGQMRLQERWSRVNALLNTEIAEAHSVRNLSNGIELVTCEADDATINRCSNGGSGYNVAICYELIPDPATGTFRLQRRGPLIDQAGDLQIHGTVKQCADFGAEVVTTGVTAFSVPEITAYGVSYTMAFRDPLDPNGSSIVKESHAITQPRPL